MGKLNEPLAEMVTASVRLSVIVRLVLEESPVIIPPTEKGPTQLMLIDVTDVVPMSPPRAIRQSDSMT